MAIAATAPRLMVGVPTGFLSPQIPAPNQDYVTSVGIEIEPGLGISLDGKAILVGPKDASEKVDILGRLPDGTYPQRDFHVTRQGMQAVVDGYYDRQDYKLEQQGSQLNVTGQTDRESFQAQFRDTGVDVQSKWPARSWKADVSGNQATVQCGWEEGRSYKLTQEGNKTIVDAGHEDINFTFTRNADGSIAIDGKLNPQDFNIRRENGALVVKGHYPQQQYVIKTA